MQLPEDFKEFIELMISHNVRFVMIGGYAYNVYRNPRATGDIDFLVSTDTGNERRLRQVLDEFGFGETLPKGTLLVEGKVIMLGRSPFRIDILNQISGTNFEEVSETAVRHTISGLDIPVISPEILLKNKRAAGRPKDLADAVELERLLKEKG